MAILTRVRWNLSMVLICIFFLTRDGENFFMGFWPFEFILLKKFYLIQLPITLSLHWIAESLTFWAPCIFWLSVLCLMYSWQIFSPALRVVSSVKRPFLLCWSFFLLCSPICPSFLLVAELMGFYWGSPLLTNCFPAFSCTNFRFSGLILRSLIHFDLILVWGDKHGSSFSFLQTDNHFSQQHFLKRLCFLHLRFLAPLSKIKWA
jgi:hypothetical protein